MITVHNYRDIPCGKTDCSYIAYSQNNFAQHKIRFHGHGKKPVEFANHTCPYPTCKVSFLFPTLLKRHLNVHENRVLSCNYCPYRNATSYKLHDHLLVHFNIKNFECDICLSKFTRKNDLTLHQKRKHSNEDFFCVDCQFTTVKIDAFDKHRKSCKERLKYSRIL
jgi:uncharacterized Zn-finger protein